MFKFTALIFTLIALSAKTSAQTVSCENIGYENWTHANRQKTCYIKITTTITTPTTSITAPTESVLGLSLWENKKISYLPVKVAESFPELLVYGAAGCSVTRISKENFINLRRMKRLDLSNNQIALVPNNAFEDLVALEWLQLQTNKIKTMDARVFNGLNKLQKVLLNGNECINEDYVDIDRAKRAAMTETVTRNCGSSTSLDSRLMEAQMASMTVELKAVKAELATTKEARTRCKNLVDLINEMTKQGEFRPSEAIVPKPEDLRNVAKMLVIIHNKNAEIVEKNEKIKKLEEKIQQLEGRN